jgi:ABC-type uncharacterized transport system involved in gliding motility auxiliary subunit
MAQTGSPRRIANLTQAVIYTIIVIGILVLVNFLANRWNKSYDSTANKRYTLSDQTAKIVKELKQPLTISYWGQPQNFPNARDLFDRYQSLSSNVKVTFEDVDKKRTQALAAGVHSPLPNIFVTVGNKKEEAKTLTEEDVTGAIVRALKGGDRTVCYVLGSGEPSTDDTNPGGLSKLKELTEKNNYKTETIKLLEKQEIPAECTIVVAAGPRREYIKAEVEAIQKYVENGGRALLMLDPPLKFGGEVDENKALAEVLKSWGVKLTDDLVLDTSGLGQVFGLGPEYTLVTSYENHAITNSMKDVPTGFPIARSMEVSDGEKTKVSALFASGQDSIATKNLASPEVRPGPNDLKGPLTLAAAGTYNTGKENVTGRFVVVGSSRFVSNGFLPFNGNRDLYMNMINWLSSDEDLISIRPKEPENRPLNMNTRQVAAVLYGSVFGIPLLIVGAGVAVWWKRRY